MMKTSAVAAALLAGLAGAYPAPAANLADRQFGPTVTAPAGTITGSVWGNVESFQGIPFAEAPTGPLRLKPPQRKDGFDSGTFDASGSSPSCPQMLFSTDSSDLLTSVLGELVDVPLFQVATGQTEDCLTITVQRPVGTSADAKLPVLFWIFGGGFELGSVGMYDGTSLLDAGIDANSPFIFVAVNYRVGGFGFLPGAEILADGSANLGLLDQRMGLEWTADNVAAFGGDPDKVTIWGESAGAISVFNQMALYDGNITYKGKSLFRGGIMNSGSLVPTNPVDSPRAQGVYDQVVEVGGCSGQSDTLECLRGLDYDTFLNAVNSPPGLIGYTSVALSYLPRPDGVAMTRSPDESVLNGLFANVPMIIGDCEDEGTLFSLFQSNITTEELLVDYLLDVFFHDATRDEMEAFVSTYPAAASAGSPFGTGSENEPYPEFKRLAAILGDTVFTLTRRAFLEGAHAVHWDQPMWSYLGSYDHGTPILGTFHFSDIIQMFYNIVPDYASEAWRAYYLSFLYNLDPNNGTGADYQTWPQHPDDLQLMHFYNDHTELLTDNFRQDSFTYLLNNIRTFYF